MKHCSPDNLPKSVVFSPFPGLLLNLSQPLLSLSKIIYIRFVLCRLRSHADEGLRSLQGLGALTVSFAGNLSAFLRCTSPFILSFCLKAPLKCVWITSSSQFWERRWEHRSALLKFWVIGFMITLICDVSGLLTNSLMLSKPVFYRRPHESQVRVGVSVFCFSYLWGF